MFGGDAPLLANGSNFCSKGSANAAVLPVPVCAPAIKSPQPTPPEWLELELAWRGVTRLG